VLLPPTENTGIAQFYFVPAKNGVPQHSTAFLFFDLCDREGWRDHLG
jgi:hypothetical protein